MSPGPTLSRRTTRRQSRTGRESRPRCLPAPSPCDAACVDSRAAKSGTPSSGRPSRKKPSSMPHWRDSGTARQDAKLIAGTGVVFCPSSRWARPASNIRDRTGSRYSATHITPRPGRVRPSRRRPNASWLPNQWRQDQGRKRAAERGGRIIDTDRRAACAQWEPVTDDPCRCRELWCLADAEHDAGYHEPAEGRDQPVHGLAQRPDDQSGTEHPARADLVDQDAERKLARSITPGKDGQQQAIWPSERPRSAQMYSLATAKVTRPR